MEPLDLIRTTHEIDRHLAELSAAVLDEDLKKDLLAFHARWRELGYRVTADLCGMVSNGASTVPARRDRRKRTDPVAATVNEQDTTQGTGS